MLKSLLYSFLNGQAEGSLIDYCNLPHDKELDARNQERAREAIKQMGDKWLFYRPVNKVR